MKNLMLLVAVSIIPAQAFAGEVLLLAIKGATSDDIADTAKAITNAGYTYTTLYSEDLNSTTIWSVSDIAQYKLIVNPGGDSITMGQNLTAAATAKIHDAVVNYGVSYLGICAGAYMAEKAGSYNVYDLAGTWFAPYAASVHTVYQIKFSHSKAPMNLVYWDGPELSGFGNIIGTYPNGDTAITEFNSGKGFVLLSAVHPESEDANDNWGGLSTYTTQDKTQDWAYAVRLVKAAYTRVPLPHF
jgi:glutamine amidotransferase PdxT